MLIYHQMILSTFSPTTENLLNNERNKLLTSLLGQLQITLYSSGG